ncbi:hypothetical protein Dsin_023485 [Dipteronia sinensis]|uniref:Uncharacterized protein n=1 Tax=Dipteronia sinensis TaxID=43782 RepID=A0AAE0A3F8_9ROSI|nr:hypothetical protein Dsin_023485 [Dipteronia sinensis]
MHPEALKLVEHLWENVADQLDYYEISDLVNEPFRIVSTAAKEGNIDFLSILIHKLSCFDTQMKVRNEMNNILHLAAKLPPDQDRLNVGAGAVFLMQREFLWFQAFCSGRCTCFYPGLHVHYTAKPYSFSVGGTSTNVDMSQSSAEWKPEVGGKREKYKGKVTQREDEERQWDDISNQYHYDSLEDGTSDDDEGNKTFDPHFKRIDTNDSYSICSGHLLLG